MNIFDYLLNLSFHNFTNMIEWTRDLLTWMKGKIMPFAIIELDENICPKYLDKESDVFAKHLNKAFRPRNENLRAVMSKSYNSKPPIPYKITSCEGDYFIPSHNPYDFTAEAVKAKAVDYSRIIDEVNLRTERDLILYKNVVKKNAEPGSKEALRLMVQMRMVEFKGDEERFIGDDGEVRDNLFFWNFAQHFSNREELYLDGEVFSMSYSDTGDVFKNKIAWGKILYNAIIDLSTRSDKTWFVSFVIHDEDEI